MLILRLSNDGTFIGNVHSTVQLTLFILRLIKRRRRSVFKFSQFCHYESSEYGGKNILMYTWYTYLIFADYLRKGENVSECIFVSGYKIACGSVWWKAWPSNMWICCNAFLSTITPISLCVVIVRVSRITVCVFLEKFVHIYTPERKTIISLLAAYQQPWRTESTQTKIRDRLIRPSCRGAQTINITRLIM